MRKLYLSIALALFAYVDSFAQEYKIITVVESVVPGGLGRSRMIENAEEVNIDDFTTERTDGRSSQQNQIKRRDAKIENFAESKLLNFYSGAGINFRNIASNDALISSKLNQISKEGWKLVFVTSGVESDAGGGGGFISGKDVGGGSAGGDGRGIFITRFIFTR